MDANLHRLLQILRGALGRALSDSSEANRAVREIRREGWSVYLVVDQEEEGSGPALELISKRGPVEVPIENLSEAPTEAPVFKIDGQDLTFLRSIGIDPTRSLRKRRS